EAAKAQRLNGAISAGVNQITDTRIKMFQDIIPEIQKWSSKNQFEFLLYLRGDEQASEFIKSKFPKFGPERIRQIYQGLPLEAARFAVESYLMQTLLARKEINEGWGRKLIAYLVKPKLSKAETEAMAKLTGADRAQFQQKLEQTHRYSSLLLEGLLVGIDRAKNKPIQRAVLSTLIAMKPGQDNSIGETIKNILEQFPGVGPKVGQFLVATQMLPDDINRVLISTQDGTLPPKRFETYKDLASIVGNGSNIGIELHGFLGGGSIKYSRKGRDLKTNWEVALQVFRENVQNNVEMQVEVINHMIAYLIEKDGKQWAFLKVIVDGAMNAVAREKEFKKEAKKTATARTDVYGKRFDEPHFTVQVPIQLQLNERLLASKFAAGVPFWKLSPADRQIVGEKILAMEAEILYPTGLNDKNHKILFDPDRHSGNYLIHVEMRAGQKHYTIYPIDFGQLNQITIGQRDRVSEMMALATMFAMGGSNDWLGEKVGSLFGIQGEALSLLQKNLAEFFPVSSASMNNSVVTAYFSLIAAINETIWPTERGATAGPKFPQTHPDLSTGRLDFIYTDFLRGIIQLNQYENNIRVTEKVRSPRAHLEKQTK
ncbi:MAG: hypothetical protein K2X47_03320, partial [Bdellovibrionales bacterium]|nr:hypothetical protein [Bdellovibrionales bacterium]